MLRANQTFPKSFTHTQNARHSTEAAQLYRAAQWRNPCISPLPSPIPAVSGQVLKAVPFDPNGSLLHYCFS
jgi:hypothetical protein